MSVPIRKRGFLLTLAAEGMSPAVPGCAASFDRAINRFGLHIIARWLDWMQDQPPALRLSAIGELADLPPSQTRVDALAGINSFAPAASVEDRARAAEYLCALPRFAQRALVLDGTTGGFTLPCGAAPDSTLSLLRLLPPDAPPHAPGAVLPGTPYQLKDLAGAGSLGSLYRATSSESDAPVLIECCTDPAMIVQLRRYADRLKPPVSSDRWHSSLVRLLEFDLGHATPYFVFEQVPGGDLAMLLTHLKHQTGHGLAPADVFRLIEQIAESLAFVHAIGLVHGDVKPANVLVSGETVKLTSAGVGLATAGHASLHSQIGRKRPEQLDPSDQASLLRGAASLLYLSPEQRRGDNPDPRHDLHALGILWYQLLIGDVTRAPADGWPEELLREHRVPAEQVRSIERCLAPEIERPQDAGALLAVMRSQEPHRESKIAPPETAVSPEEIRRELLRKQSLMHELKELRGEIDEYHEQLQHLKQFSVGDVFRLFLLPIPFGLTYALTNNGWIALAALILVAGELLLVRRTYHRTCTEIMLSLMKDRAARLAREHPEEIESWGGGEKLLNRELLAEALAAFEEDMRTLSPEIEAES